MKFKSTCILLLLMFYMVSFAGEPTLAQLHERVDPYFQKVRTQPDWLYSRLQMYWKSHATEVYINGETFDHVGGTRAPFPTVKLNGTRGMESAYNLPRLEDVVPYDDDDAGNVTYVNRLSGKMEKASPAKTGCNINTLNLRILDIALNAAKIYAQTGDTLYAKMAYDVFDVYLKGIYYRNVPIDLSHGHIQTLVGMTTFEVIHEDAVNAVTQIYRLLGNYIKKDRNLYEAGMKKWADNIIANGVPHNNWDLFQAEFVAKIALVLRNDSAYSDRRGRQYYLDVIFNRSSVRQWSLKKLADFGFDPQTHIWYEAPGYSTTVLGDFCDFANRMDRDAGMDLFAQLPVLQQAVTTSPQYLFPNRMIVGFGDTHPNYLSSEAVDNILDYASRHQDRQRENVFSRLKSAIRPDAPDTLVAQYVTPSFYAPNVSWLVQRTGMNRNHDLMISLNGSLGNHQHANGISMELYGKGYVLGPDAGIGKFLYSGADYNEYYSQFPAHNTVCVDGISSYPVMMSSHAFKVDDRFPDNNVEHQFSPVTYSQVSFIEPESYSEQVRTNGIVKTSKQGGYYVDIFRSCKKEGGDKTHDYFYHNLGQQMTVTTVDGDSLPFHSTDELALAGGHLYAYSYLYNKECAEYDGDLKATFVTTVDTLKLRNAPYHRIGMTLWMKGDSHRKIFKALSPVNLEYERMPGQPYSIEDQPVLTFVARQEGEAWTHPFVAVYEPSTDTEPSEIQKVEYFRPKSKDPSAVGIIVYLKTGRTDYIFSSVRGSEMRYGKRKVKGHYAVISDHFTLIDHQYNEK